MNTDCQDTRQPPINRRRERDSKKKHNTNTVIRMLRVALRPDPKG
jgi:hypothetical protein